MKTFVVGDIHGRIHSLEKLLRKANVITKKGKRKQATKDARIIQLGDLANVVLRDQAGDEECLLMAPEWFDVILMGNHEAGYVFPDITFSGFWAAPHLQSLYNAYYRDGLVQPATVVGNTLVSHAGVVKEFDFHTPGEAYAEISDVWRTYNSVSYERRLLLNACGRIRGGYMPYGGILWSHWTEPKNARFNQVVGHTTCGPDLFEHKGGTWALNIDSDVRRGESVTGVWLDDAGQIEEIVTAKLS